MSPSVARPEKTELTPQDYDLLDAAEFQDLLDWDRRRLSGDGRLGEYGARQIYERLRWLKGYCLRLRARLRESQSATYIRELERENAHMEVRLHRQAVRLESLREQNAGLRRAVSRAGKALPPRKASGGPRAHVDEDLDAEILELRRAGSTCEEAADQLGVSVTQVWACSRRHGVQGRWRWHRKKE